MIYCIQTTDTHKSLHRTLDLFSLGRNKIIQHIYRLFNTYTTHYANAADKYEL